VLAAAWNGDDAVNLQHNSEDDDPRIAAQKWQRSLRSDMRDGSLYTERRSPSSPTAALLRSASTSPSRSRSPPARGLSPSQQHTRSSMSPSRATSLAAAYMAVNSQPGRPAPPGAGGAAHARQPPSVADDAQHGAGPPELALDAMVATKVQFIKAEVSKDPMPECSPACQDGQQDIHLPGVSQAAAAAAAHSRRMHDECTVRSSVC
jgi:hypothetical protein